jgi:hypothetical protein
MWNSFVCQFPSIRFKRMSCSRQIQVFVQPAVLFVFCANTRGIHQKRRFYVILQKLKWKKSALHTQDTRPILFYERILLQTLQPPT